MSEQWAYWLEWNGPQIFFVVVFLVFALRLWRRQFKKSDEMLAIARENQELLRQSVARLEEVREILKGKP